MFHRYVASQLESGELERSIDGIEPKALEEWGVAKLLFHPRFRPTQMAFSSACLSLYGIPDHSMLSQGEPHCGGAAWESESTVPAAC